MNDKIISQSQKSILSLYREVVMMRKAFESLRRRLLKVLPAEECSDLWWEKENLLASEEIKRGEYKEFSSGKEYLKYLKTLKS